MNDLDDLGGIQSDASDNFYHAIKDPKRLLALYDEVSAGKLTHAARRHSVLKRTAIVLLVTTWETYIEDMLRERFSDKMAKHPSPDEFSSALQARAQHWLQGSPKPPEIMKWVGGGWKSMLEEDFERQISALNTPNTQNICRLSKLYLSVDITQYWKWQGVSAASAQERLDELIKLRGQIAHRARDVYSWSDLIQKTVAVKSLKLIQGLVESTNNYFNIKWAKIKPGLVG